MPAVDPKSFEQFVQDNGIKLGLKGWLALHPGLKEELHRLIIKGASPSLLYDWLVKEYDYPLARTSVIRYSTTLKASI